MRSYEGPDLNKDYKQLMTAETGTNGLFVMNTLLAYSILSGHPWNHAHKCNTEKDLAISLHY